MSAQHLAVIALALVAIAGGIALGNWSWNLMDRKRRAPFRNPVAHRKLGALDYEVTLEDGRVFIGGGSLWYDKATGKWLDWPGWAMLAEYLRRERHK